MADKFADVHAAALLHVRTAAALAVDLRCNMRDHAASLDIRPSALPCTPA